MYIDNFFTLLVMAGILWNIVTAIGIHHKLEYNHVLQNMALIRYAPWVRLAEYKTTTEMETGHTGTLYYQYVLSLFLVAVSAAVLISLRIAN